jgi:hypothetical protein
MEDPRTFGGLYSFNVACHSYPGFGCLFQSAGSGAGVAALFV